MTTPANDSDKIRLLCWVQGDPVSRVFAVSVKLTDTVIELREAILQKKPSFKDIDANQLEPYKAVASIDDSTGHVNQLDSGQKLVATTVISTIWKNQPPKDVINVILPRPTGTTITPSSSNERKFSDERKDKTDGQGPSKRQRLDDNKASVKPVFQLMWDIFWGKPADECFVQEQVHIPDSRTLKKSDELTAFTYMKLPNDHEFPFGLPRILIPTTYTDFYEELCREDARWASFPRRESPAFSTVITGSPGTGKRALLSYILTRRLQEEKPTIYCNNPGFFYVFTNAGVKKVSWQEDDTVEVLQDTNSCALVNITDSSPVDIPPSFYPGLRRCRVVVATPPNPAHIKIFRRHPPKIYTLPTWMWEDLYCASMIQTPGPPKLPPNERLQNIFAMLGGIPQRCFGALFCGSEDENNARKIITDDINKISSIRSFAMTVSGAMPFEDPWSDTLIRIEPRDDCGRPCTHLLSGYVADLLYERLPQLQTSIRDSLSSLLCTHHALSWVRDLFKRGIQRRFRAGITFRPEALDDGAPRLNVTINPAEGGADTYFHAAREVAATPLNQYLVPFSSASAAVDSVCISEDVTVFFQITVSETHDLKLDGITKLIDELSDEAKNKICIVFVIPDHPITRRKPYKRQGIVIQDGTLSEVVELVTALPQYVYYADMDEFF